MVLPRVALTAEEVAAAVGQQAMVIKELASALVEVRQPVVLGFPICSKLCDVSSLRDANGRWLSERDVPVLTETPVFSCLQRRHISRYLLLLASDLLNDALKGRRDRSTKNTETQLTVRKALIAIDVGADGVAA